MDKISNFVKPFSAGTLELIPSIVAISFFEL